MINFTEVSKVESNSVHIIYHATVPSRTEKLLKSAEQMKFESKKTKIFPSSSTPSEAKNKRTSEFCATKSGHRSSFRQKWKKVEWTPKNIPPKVENRIIRNCDEKGHKKFSPKEQPRKNFEVKKGGCENSGKSGRIFSRKTKVQLGTIEILGGRDEFGRKRLLGRNPPRENAGRNVALDGKGPLTNYGKNLNSFRQRRVFWPMRADADQMSRGTLPFDRGWVELTASCPGSISPSADGQQKMRGLQRNGSELIPNGHHLSTAGCEMCS
ncbi:hypothetical protein niasHT_030049 [Heterodera trifolii]|uniref:Uncharacterized protein n=1 Tax=Heterodera trifolii TaxID=157864 RepID=A0ABD2JQM6_9BILA